MILLTSFRRAQSKDFSFPKIPCFSAAVYQPKNCNFPKAKWADIRWPGGTWIRPREFVEWDHPLNGYFGNLLALYLSRTDEIMKWLHKHPKAALLCWCPYEKAAQRQIRQHGTFVCHLGVVEAYLRQQGMQVKVDDDRRDKMVRFY